jgi:hypothetical protein
MNPRQVRANACQDHFGSPAPEPFLEALPEV